jgi:hypothetical protein
MHVPQQQNLSTDRTHLSYLKTQFEIRQVYVANGWNEVVLAYFRMPFHVSVGTEENHENPQLRSYVSGPKYGTASHEI